MLEIFQVFERVVGKDTVRATRAIRKILSSVEDHGIVNIFSRHDARQVVISMYALTRLQAACQRHERILDGKISGPTAWQTKPRQAGPKTGPATTPWKAGSKAGKETRRNDQGPKRTPVGTKRPKQEKIRLL